MILILPNSVKFNAILRAKLVKLCRGTQQGAAMATVSNITIKTLLEMIFFLNSKVLIHYVITYIILAHDLGTNNNDSMVHKL